MYAEICSKCAAYELVCHNYSLWKVGVFKVADMAADMVAHMEVNMVANKVADTVADMEIDMVADMEMDMFRWVNLVEF